MPDPLTLLGFIFILGALIFIHEAGHYMVAKSLGIRVEVFSLGFGPKLLRFRRGGTEYCISALPLGGYVKMLGENPDEDLRGSKEEFLSRSKFERFLVLVMGATLNIVLAVILYSGIYMHGVPEPIYLTQPPVIGSMDPNATAAASGLEIRDVILRVGGQDIDTWRGLQLEVALNPNKTLDFLVRRDGEEISLPVLVGETDREKIGFIGIGPLTPITVAAVVEKGAAETAGLQVGDVLSRIDDVEVTGLRDALERLRTAVPGEEVLVQVDRDGEPREARIVPADRDGDGDVGLALSYATRFRRFGPVEAIGESVKVSWQQAGVLFVTLKKLVAGQLSPHTLSGPIEIYRLTGESMRSGPVYFVSFMALISLQLGIINLLPIPILDGGHIFILLIEGLIRRDLSMRIKERVMQVGLILILLLMGGVIYLDVVKNL